MNDQLKGQTTWPEQFAQAGYTTFLTGKWHNGAESALRSFQRGKAIFLGGRGAPYHLPLQDIGATRVFENQRASREHSVQVFADAAVEFLQEQKGGSPLLCYVAFNGPHDPRIAPKEYRPRFDGREPPAPGNFLPVHPFNNGEMTVRDEALAPRPRSPGRASRRGGRARRCAISRIFSRRSARSPGCPRRRGARAGASPRGWREMSGRRVRRS